MKFYTIYKIATTPTLPIKTYELWEDLCPREKHITLKAFAIKQDKRKINELIFSTQRHKKQETKGKRRKDKTNCRIHIQRRTGIDK